MFHKFFLLSIFCSSIQLASGYICNSTSSSNRAPVIGVLAQEIWNNGLTPNNSMIVAGYVKFLEMAGAQVVPILLKQNDEYYNDLYHKINGLLIPGGSMLEGSMIMKTAKKFWIKATNNNEKLAWRNKTERKANYFPIFGICLGFEFMFDFISGEPSRFTKFDAFVTKNSVHLTKSNQQLREGTKLFKNAPEKILNSLRKKKITMNFHHRCMTIQNMTKYNLNENIRVLGTNLDKNGLKHVSIIESKYYPFFGVAFHPEVVLFEFKDYKAHHNIPHSFSAIQVSQYFANFFVQKTHKNKNCFDSQDELNSYLIHNYPVQFTGKSKNDRYMQKYFFPL